MYICILIEVIAVPYVFIFYDDDKKITKCFNTGVKKPFLLLFLWVTKIVLFILLFYYIDNGDMDKYDNFLDCKYVKKYVFKKFSDIEKFRGIFFGFSLVNIISEVIDKLKDFFDLWQENLEKKE